MIGNKNGKRTALIYALTLAAAIAVLAVSVFRTNAYNNARHEKAFVGPELFTEDAQTGDVSVKAVPRSGSWTKIFVFDDEAHTERNYQAYTYDITVANNTKDEVSDFSFRLTFSRDAYLASAWNGALEIHQMRSDGERVDTIPDLREFVPDDYALEFFAVDGESFVAMKAGDYLVYLPSASMNAMEVPIEPYEATTPGIIMYVAEEETIEESALELSYTFHRLLKSEPSFWIALGSIAIWLISLIFYVITRAQIRQYQERHERDNRIINESIETFTGFIDAKDPYTNGHSKRVAQYTRQIAKELGYDGEELDRIYYIALLHDCGKIAVPDSILGKPGKLTEDEFEIIKSHTVRGGEILSRFRSLKDAGEGALYHHERYDGTGYPEGRAGADIPRIARMICVADAFDAMNTDRVYRKKLARERIIEELETNKGSQFDPAIADIMLSLLRDGKLHI